MTLASGHPPSDVGSSATEPTPLKHDQKGRTGRADFWTLVSLACAVFGLYTFLVLWLGNTNLVTTNGLWKLPVVQEWENLNLGPIQPSNFLYFPVTGLGITLLPSRLFGEGWVRVSLLNAGWAAIAVAAIYVTCRGIGLPRLAAIAASLAQAGFAFFLVLGVTSEDIMGGYALLCTTVSVVVWSSRSSGARSMTRWALAGALFALTFLWEWRLLFPSLPAISLAIVVSDGTPRQRAKKLAVFFSGFFLMLSIAVAFWMLLEPTGGDFLARAKKLLWTGKATDSGWAGWSTAKIWFLLIGITQYPIGGRNIITLHTDAITDPRTYVVAIVIAMLFAALVLWAWQNRNNPSTRIGAVCIVITFLAGCVMNLWSQPQDPQMQLNVMMFLPISVGAATHLASHAVEKRARGRAMVNPRAGGLVGAIRVIACSLGPILLVVNVWGTGGYAESRGGDNLSVGRVKSLFTAVDPTRSVFLIHGFESEATWMNVMTGIEWELMWPPPPTPRAKLIGVASTPVAQPHLSAAATADHVVSQINMAWQTGYEVVASPFWGLTKQEFIGSLRVVAKEDKARAIYEKLHSSFCGRSVRVDLWSGEFFRLIPKAAESPGSGGGATGTLENTDGCLER